MLLLLYCCTLFRKVVTAGMAVKAERLTVFKNVPYGMRLKAPLTFEAQLLAFSWRKRLEPTGEGGERRVTGALKPVSSGLVKLASLGW